MVAQNVAFGIIAAVIVVAAARVVTTRNIVHAALYLVLVLAAVGAQFILLAAEFIAITQVLLYVGAIVVLFLFGIMLTRAPIGPSMEVDNEQRIVAGLVAVALAALLGYALVDGFSDLELPGEEVQRTAEVSDSIFSTYLVPFELASILLLGALIGAIVIARRD